MPSVPRDDIFFVCRLIGMIGTLPFVAAVVAWVLGGRTRKRSDAGHIFRRVSLVAGVLVTVVTVYAIILVYIPVLALWWIPNVYLFLAALVLLDGWHRRESVLCVFWPGTFVVASACVAWGVLLYFFVPLIVGYQDDVVRLSIWSFTEVWSIGTLGSAMTAVGWLFWQRALRRHENPNLYY